MFTKLYIQISNFMADRKGVTAIEYAVLAVAIVIVIFAVFGTDGGELKTALDDAFQKITETLDAETA